MTGQVTALVRQIIDRVYPVSVILDFAAEVDPNTVIGCGTVWERITDGRALIASSEAHPVGSACGAESVTMTVEHMPYHEHGQYLYFAAGEGLDIYAYHALNSYQPGGIRAYSSQTGGSGGGQPHNNMQPSLAVCRWKRVA